MIVVEAHTKWLSIVSTEDLTRFVAFYAHSVSSIIENLYNKRSNETYRPKECFENMKHRNKGTCNWGYCFLSL